MPHKDINERRKCVLKSYYKHKGEEKNKIRKKIYNHSYGQYFKSYKHIFTPKTFLAKCLNVTRKNDRKVNREFNIDIKYLLELWELQGGKCAVTGIQMTYKFRDLRAVSIDRIDSTKGHIKGNIQLVCQFYNLGKKDHPDDQARSFIQSIKQEIKRTSS